MMILTEDLTERLLITNYTPEAIRIQEKDYNTNILIAPSGQIFAWPVKTLEDMNAEDCQKIVSFRPEIVIIGTGAVHKLPNLDIIHHFDNFKIGIEIMNTAAACRTYNVLALENRQIVTALIL